jgi:hypothetical protein
MGVLSILAIVIGSQVDSLNVTGRARQASSGLYLIGQWMLPIAIWTVAATEMAIIGMSIMIWGLCLILSMLIMAHQAWTADSRTGSAGGPTMQSAD